MTTISPFPSFKMKAVPILPPGSTSAVAIKPHHTPSLLEMLGINPHRDGTQAFIRETAAAIKASKEHREGVKVKR